MSKPFDYSKWDKIELSDDEDDVYPNIDKESWFRMKHRSRVEREENEEKDKAKIREETEKANRRIKTLEHDLKKIKERKAEDSDSDDDLDETEGIQAEINELKQANAAREEKLQEYEKNKKWNVDNMFEVKEERTFINPSAGKNNYTESGFVEPKDEELKPKGLKDTPKPTPAAATKPVPAGPAKPSTSPSPPKPMPEHNPPPVEVGAFETYAQFTDKYAETVELFMAIPDLEGSKEFLLKFADILLQENASNYLLLASLEDEMNGHREKMKRTARQSQIISNIAELAKTVKTHPGNVIVPFFKRLEQREHLEEFIKGCKAFQERIIERAIVKRQEIDAQRAAEAQEAQKTDLHDIPREQRLGPGGLDPLEVIETLPESMVKAFESRNVENLKAALMAMEPEEAQHHMERCIASGLWVDNSSE